MPWRRRFTISIYSRYKCCETPSILPNFKHILPIEIYAHLGARLIQLTPYTQRRVPVHQRPNTRIRRKTTVRDPDPAFPYTDELNADPRLVGGPALMNPMPQMNSAARLDMFRSHLSQAVIIEGCNFPYIFTGKEMDFGRYEMQGGAAEREQDGQVIAVIPKYPTRTVGLDRILENPKSTVIYRGLDDNLIHCFDINSYAAGQPGFGYVNKFKNEHLLYKDTHLPSDAILAHSNARQGNKYCLGVNLNVAYMTDVNTVKDAMYISRSAAKAMRSTAINTRTISVRANEHPINHHGDEYSAKFLLDIGETVGEDGVFCALRPVSTETFAADMNPANLREVQALHDRVIRLPPGSKIVDLNFYTTSKRDQIPWSVYGQVEKYVEAIKIYWERIIEVHAEYSGKYRISPRFSNLVTNAMLHLSAHGGRVKGIPNKKVRFVNRTDHAVEFLQIEVTYTHPRDVGIGFKITDSHGTKGTICRIVEDEDMPVDDFGIRADVVIDPASVVARMNMGQLAEQAINRTSEFVRRQLEALYPTDPLGAFELLLNYYNDIHPNYADLVRRVKDTDEKRRKHVAEEIHTGIHINIPPFLASFDDPDSFKRVLSALEISNPELAKKIREEHCFYEKLLPPEEYEENLFMYLRRKWNVPVSPVTYALRDEQGNRQIIRTNKPVLIGPKYMYLLCKVPEPSAPGVAHVSHHGIPMKTPSEVRMESEISTNPTRFGEDEQRIALQDVDGAENFRLMSLQSASPEGVATAVRTILDAEYPTRIGRIPITNEQLRDTNAIIGLFGHIMATEGVDVLNTEVSAEDFPAFMLENVPPDALLDLDDGDDDLPDSDDEDPTDDE